MYIINTKDAKVFLHKNDILYCLAEGSYSKVVLKDKKTILVSKNLKSIESTIDRDTFIRIHRSHIVNVNYVKKMDKRASLLTMDDDEELLITDTSMSNLLNHFVVI